MFATRTLTLTTSALCLAASLAQADQVILDDLIVDGSICAGMDCVNGESFGFDTLRLKENNLRIKAQDTSSTSSFPTNDWQITFNDSANGGANKFSIDDIDGGRTPFTIEAGAPSHSLYVDDGGRIGLGTATPVVELHLKNGDTPTLRLEQDGSSGFAAQTWDVAGNETNFFVRDATNGSKLPFRIISDAPNNALYVASDGDVGFGTASPDAGLHVTRGSVIIEDGDTGPGDAPLHMRLSDGSAKILIEETSAIEADRGLLELKNNGNAFITLTDTSGGGGSWNIQNRGSNGSNELRFTNSVGLGEEFTLSQNGELTITGGLISLGATTVACTAVLPCDAVFDPDIYDVPSIDDHAALMWENKYLPAVGPTSPDQPVNVTTKMLRMLNELEHAHIYIEQLHKRVEGLEVQLTALQ